MSKIYSVSPNLTPGQREQIRKDLCVMHWGPNTVRLVDVRSKREPWFWLKRITYGLGLREKPPCWHVTYNAVSVP